jgi:hypothetical protein
MALKSITYTFVFANHKCINFYVFKRFFFLSEFLLICSSNLIYMYFHQGSKNLKIYKMIYYLQFSILERLILFFMLMHETIVVKMANSHLFEMVSKKKIMEGKDLIMKSINNMVFFTCTHVLTFCNGFSNNDTS